jgi:hypothetical protein
METFHVAALLAASIGAVVIAYWMILRKRTQPTDEIVENCHCSITDEDMEKRKLFISKDKPILELVFDFRSVKEVSVKGTLSFFLTKVPEKDEDFWLDYQCRQRIRLLKINGELVSSQHYSKGKLFLPCLKLKHKKNTLEFQTLAKFENNFDGFIKVGACISIQPNLCAWSRVFPCLDHPSVEYEVSMKLLLPNRALAVSSLGNALCSSNEQVSNKKSARLFNIGLALIQNPICQNERYENIEIDWNYSSDISKSIELLAPIIKIAAEKLKTLFPHDSEHKVNIFVGDGLQLGCWVGMGMMPTELVTDPDRIIDLVDLFCNMLVKSLERKVYFSSFNQLCVYNSLAGLLSAHVVQAIIQEELIHQDKLNVFKSLLSKTICSSLTNLENTRTKYLCTSDYLAQWSNKMMVGCTPNLTTLLSTTSTTASALSSHIESSFRLRTQEDLDLHKKISIELRVLTSDRAYLKVIGSKDNQTAINETLILYKYSTSGSVQQIECNLPKSTKKKPGKVELCLADNEVILADNFFLRVSQPLDRIRGLQVVDELALLVKLSAIRSALAVGDLNVEEYSTELLELLRSHILSAKTFKLVLQSTASAIATVDEEVIKERLLQSLLHNLSNKKLAKFTSDSSISPLIENLNQKQRLNSTFAERLNSLSITSEGDYDLLLEHFPLISSQQELKKIQDLRNRCEISSQLIDFAEATLLGRQAFIQSIFPLHYCEESIVENHKELANDLNSPKQTVPEKSLSWEIFNEENTKEDHKADLNLTKLNSKVIAGSLTSTKHIGSDSEKIENILNKLSEYCDSNNLSDANSMSSPGKLMKKASKISAENLEADMSERFIQGKKTKEEGVNLNNISTISALTVESRFETQSQRGYKPKFSESVDQRLNNSARKAAKPTSSKSRNNKNLLKNLDESSGNSKPSSIPEPQPFDHKSNQKKIDSKYNKNKEKKIVEEECEYTPKNIAQSKLQFSKASLSTEIEKWEEEFNKEINYFIDIDLNSLKLKYLENESDKKKQELLTSLKEKYYKNFVSVYLLMRARKKSDIESIFRLVRDCGMINSISFPESQLREVTNWVTTARTLNCRFKRASFVELLVRVAVERYFELGETDTPAEVKKGLNRLWPAYGGSCRPTLKRISTSPS